MLQLIIAQQDQDFLELQILKRNKISSHEFLASKTSAQGYIPAFFRKIKRYSVNPMHIPPAGSDFSEAKSLVIPNFHNINSENLQKLIEITKQHNSIKNSMGGKKSLSPHRNLSST